MISFRKISKKILTCLLVPVILIYFFNAAVNQHTHVLDRGVIITHAHPYSKTSDGNAPLKSHDHTDNQYLLLSQISIPVLTLLIIIFLFLSGVIRLFTFINPVYSLVVRGLFNNNSLRAPPAFNQVF